ncbi:retrovirus-related pol polyprotein from transposon TNT 1-94 [Tanacetum coccineum]|uniref:Retrovirus-related pol polyprotein from transposon TNT 1-94 n=1 Tax=Tanacetum coccineum TaxID=301880 RepID=A0ABQ5DFW9_9ASTR
MAYPCLHSPKTTKGNKINTPPIRRIRQGRYGVSVHALTKDHKRNKINTPYPEKSIRRIGNMPTISSLNNDEIDFRISFDESDDEDCTPTVSYSDDLDYFKDFEKEFPAIVYNDAQTSKLDFLTEPTDGCRNQNDVKVKQIRTDNGTEFRNSELKSFCDEKGISQNFSSPYTPEQNGVAKRNNITLIKDAKTMLNGLVLCKHLWTEAVRIACYTQNRSIIVKRHDKTPYEIFKERIHDIRYFHVFGCPVFIHNHKDHLGKFDVKADDGYFLGYLFNSKAFRVFNTRRQKIEETYHVTFDGSK